MIYLIGDIHGKFINYKELLDSLPSNVTTIQLGDFGLGFGQNPQPSLLRENDYFFLGNHDNVNDAPLYRPNYLGRYGDITSVFKGENSAFFISGANSIDKHLRTPGINWWESEELSIEECEDAIEQYKKLKPNIVLSHDCPNVIAEAIVSTVHTLDPQMRGYGPFKPSRTTLVLQELLKIHQPQYWYFGHYHLTWMVKHYGTEFRCVNELQKVQI